MRRRRRFFFVLVDADLRRFRVSDAVEDDDLLSERVVVQRERGRRVYCYSDRQSLTRDEAIADAEHLTGYRCAGYVAW